METIFKGKYKGIKFEYTPHSRSDESKGILITNHYYCKECRVKAVNERKEKLSKDREIADLKRRLEALQKGR